MKLVEKGTQRSEKVSHRNKEEKRGGENGWFSCTASNGFRCWKSK